MRWRRPLVAIIGVGLVALTVRTTSGRRKNLGEFVPVRPQLTRVLMKSCLPLVVDIYWLRAINAVGTARTEAEHRNLAEYGRVLSTLDPRFEHPYWLIGLVLPFNRGREEWVHGDLAVELLEKGVSQFPDNLRLKLLLGYSLMTFTDRHADAARAFLDASKLPNAPPFANRLASRLYLKGGQYETALSVAEAMRDGATTDEERSEFEARITELLDEKVLRALDDAGKQFYEKHQRYPSGLDELVAEELTERPQDPRFGQIRFDSLGRALLPESKGRYKVFHDSFGGRDNDAPETWR